MALTVEDGSGVADADAYVSVADCGTYHTAMGNAAWTGDDVDKESAIRRATVYLDGKRWQGKPTGGRTQSLDWPRTGVLDADGYEIASDELPQEIIDACCELALRELVTPNSLSPDFTASDKVTREKVGEIEVEYASTSSAAMSATPVIQSVDYLIDQFLANGGSNTSFLERA